MKQSLWWVQRLNSMEILTQLHQVLVWESFFKEDKKFFGLDNQWKQNQNVLPHEVLTISPKNRSSGWIKIHSNLQEKGLCVAEHGILSKHSAAASNASTTAVIIVRLWVCNVSRRVGMTTKPPPPAAFAGMSWSPNSNAHSSSACFWLQPFLNRK